MQHDREEGGDGRLVVNVLVVYVCVLLDISLAHPKMHVTLLLTSLNVSGAI